MKMNLLLSGKLLLFLFCAPQCAALAQTPPDVVSIGLLPYTYESANLSEEFVTALQGNIATIFKNNERFKLVDRGTGGSQRQYYQRPEVMASGQQQGVQYLMALHYYGTDHRTRKKKQMVINGSEVEFDVFMTDLRFSLKLYDVTTGELKTDKIFFVYSDEVNLFNYSTNTQPNVDRAALLKIGYKASDDRARAESVKRVSAFVNEIFPLRVKIKEVLDQTEEGISRIALDGGKNIGISSNDRYYLYLLKDYQENGKIITRKVKIAFADYPRSLTATRAEMKIWTGRKALMKAYKEGATVYCSPEGTGLQVNPKQSITIAISSFLRKDTISDANLNWLEELSANSILAHERIKVVERKNLLTLSKERELQKTEDYLDAAVIEQGKSQGADYLIFGEAYISQTWLHQQEGIFSPKSGYYTNLKVDFKMVNVATGKVESEKMIAVLQNSSFTNNPYISTSASQQAAMYELQQRMNRWLLQTFPLELDIIEVTDVSKKGAAERVLINGGSAYGLHMRVTNSTVNSLAGTPFEVFEVTSEEVDGKQMERTVEIGQIVLKKVENDLVSECKVRSGGDIIQSNILAGKKMVCRIKRAVIED